MIQDVLSNHVIELLHTIVVEDRVTWPGPIARQLVAEVQWLRDELSMRPTINGAPTTGHQQRGPDNGAQTMGHRQTLPLAIESFSRFDPANQRAIELQTLLMVTNSATLFLDQQLNIKRFTPRVRELFDILPSDQGQPLTRLSDRLDCTSLVDDVAEVLRLRTHIERETRSQADQWFLMRIFPYRTLDDRIDGVVITFSDITRLKETESRLKQSQQQIESLTEKWEMSVVEQREQVRRLVSEVLITEQKTQQAIVQILHDDLQQILFSLQMQTDDVSRMLSSDEQLLLEHVRKLREAVDLAFTITRQLAVDLMPPVMLSENFTESLDWLVVLMKERYGLEVELKITLPSSWPGQEVNILIYQTIRELLFNVVKHAGTKQAQVMVIKEGGRLSITVSDRGQGFDVAATMVARPHHGGLGLFGIRNRLELFGGQFSVESRADLGTRATIVVLV